jgi:RES domain-containing protein
LVHTEDVRVLSDTRWVTIPVGIEDALIEVLHPVPEDWKSLPAPQSTREAGTRWVREARSAVLEVPSIVVNGEFNYLLNPEHPDFERLEIGSALPFSFDPRLT